MRPLLAGQLLLTCSLCAAQTGGPTAEKPRALVAFEEARQSIVYADVHWSRTLPLRESPRDEESHNRSLVARGDTAMMILGTRSGITKYNQDNEPIFDEPPALLENNDGLWHNNMNETVAYLHFPSDANPTLARFPSIGMTHSIDCGAPPEEAIDKAVARVCGAAKYTEDVVDGVVRVEASSEDGRNAIIWRIDPAVGWNATDIEYRFDGEVRYRSQSEYEEMNGVFVPVSVAYFNAAGEVFCLDTVYEAEVNTPDLPRELVPENIGIEIGTAVFIQNSPAGEPQYAYAGDGKLLPSNEFFKREHRGEIDSGPKRIAELAGQPIPYSVPDPKEVRKQIEEMRRRALIEKPMDDWELYTRAFIRKFTLDDEQTQKAIQILRSCQAERDHYLRGKKRILDKLNEQLKAAGGLPKPVANDADKPPADTGAKSSAGVAAEPVANNSAGDASRRAEIEEQIKRLHEPVDRIFEHKLKPRLDRLPTRQQRKAVEGKP